MRIMVIADEESKYLWDFFDKSKLAGVDLIISCGDLNPNYLSFLTTFAAAPVLYVHGNHDEKYDRIPPCLLYTSAKGSLKNVSREEVHEMVDELFDEYGGKE